MNRSQLTRAIAISGLIGWLLAMSARGYAEENSIVLENGILRLEFSAHDASFNVLDKRINHRWIPLPGCESFYVAKCGRESSRALNAELIQYGGEYQVRIELDGADVKVEIGAKNLRQALRDPLVYPYPFAMNPADGNLVAPALCGSLWPLASPDIANAEFSVWGGQWGASALSMPWMGVTDLKKGVMVIAATAADAAFRTVKQPAEALGFGRDSSSFAVAWPPSKGALGLKRRAIVHFTSEGGYVAQAKRYRRYCREIGRFKTLAEKITDNPNHEKLIGAPQIWIWDTARTAGFMRRLKADGIEKASIFFNVNNGPNHPLYKPVSIAEDIPQLDHPNYHRPDPELCEAALECGFLWAPYDCYHDYEDPLHIPWIRSFVPLRYWENYSAALRDRDTYPIGWAGKGFRWCTSFMMELANMRIPLEVEAFSFDGWFLDVTTAISLRECYSPDHPMTREEDGLNRLRAFQYCYNDLNLVVGSENGADWAIPVCAYYQGGLGLTKDWGPEAGRGFSTWDPVKRPVDNPYYMGDWSDKNTPSSMLGRAEKATPEYWATGLNEALRIPLFQLVHGDEALMTFRWEDVNFKHEDAWRWKDLLCILYGEVPIWNLTEELYEELREPLIASYNDVCRWSGKVKTAELIEHRFLTDDRSVQQSKWSNGMSVIVNFNPKDGYQTADGALVEPLSYLTLGAP